jgi:hypothetical protein
MFLKRMVHSQSTLQGQIEKKLPFITAVISSYYSISANILSKILYIQIKKELDHDDYDVFEDYKKLHNRHKIT